MKYSQIREKERERENRSSINTSATSKILGRRYIFKLKKIVEIRVSIHLSILKKQKGIFEPSPTMN